MKEEYTVTRHVDDTTEEEIRFAADALNQLAVE